MDPLAGSGRQMTREEVAQITGMIPSLRNQGMGIPAQVMGRNRGGMGIPAEVMAGGSKGWNTGW